MIQALEEALNCEGLIKPLALINISWITNFSVWMLLYLEICCINRRIKYKNNRTNKHVAVEFYKHKQNKKGRKLTAMKNKKKLYSK